jgi:hypothetical protein
MHYYNPETLFKITLKLSEVIPLPHDRMKSFERGTQRMHSKGETPPPTHQLNLRPPRNEGGKGSRFVSPGATICRHENAGGSGLISERGNSIQK